MAGATYTYAQYLERFSRKSCENQDPSLRTPEEEGKALADETISLFREALGMESTEATAETAPQS